MVNCQTFPVKREYAFSLYIDKSENYFKCLQITAINEQLKKYISFAMLPLLTRIFSAVN